MTVRSTVVLDQPGNLNPGVGRKPCGTVSWYASLKMQMKLGLGKRMYEFGEAGIQHCVFLDRTYSTGISIFPRPELRSNITCDNLDATAMMLAGVFLFFEL